MTESVGALRYEPIAVSDESTVVVEFLSEPVKESAYQSEAALEAAFIELLQGQAYGYLPITSTSALEANLRAQLAELNKIEFTDAEWQRFFTEKIASANDGIVEKTARIQEDHVQVLKRDDGTVKNVYLIDKVHVHNNRLQVINQYEVPSASGAHANRYDATVLVNGLPLVHVELKRRGVDIREAFNQINRYQRDSFWADSGLFEYVQLFVISNGTLTKYRWRFPPWWSRHCTDGRPHKRESSSRQGRAGPTPISCSPPESGHLSTPHTCAGTSVPSPCVLACLVCGRCTSCGTRRCRSSRLPEYLSNRSRIRQVTGTLG